MAGKEIKQRIVLEGEKQYNQAIKEAQRNLKTLKSELKAETAELGRNATEQQKAEARAKSLKQQIAEQEKIVKTLREALDQAKKEYGDNAEVVQSWEQKLNNARTTLANMKNDLDGVGQSFGGVQVNAAQATVATKSVADALGSIGGAGESVAGAIENIFTGLIDRVTETVEALWSLITETAAKANNWTDLASYYGSSAQELQMWSRSIEAAGGSFDKFQSIVSRMAFGGKEKSITELLGVSKENYQNDVEYTIAALDELERRRESLGQGWYDKTMSELFGARRSADVSWFLANAHGHYDATGNWVEGWRDNPDRFNGNESGYGMSDSELSTMNDVYVRLQEIETKWAAIKDNFAAGFGVAALDLMVNVSGTLDGIADYMNATNDEEKQAALDKIRTNVEEFFTKLGEIIRDSIHILHDVGMELSESDDPLTAAIGDILVKLSEGLQWMVDHQEDVKKAFETIFGAWLLGKLAAVAGKLSSILMQIEAIKAFKGIGTGAGTGTGGGATGGGFFTGISNWLTSVLPGAANWVSVNGGPVWDWLTHESPIAGVLNGQESIGDFLSRTGAEIQQNASTFGEDWAHLGDPNKGKSTETNEYGLTDEQTHYLRLFYQAYSHLQRDGELSDSEMGNYNTAGQKLPELFMGQEDLLQYYMNKMKTYGNADGLLGDDFFQRTAEKIAEVIENVDLDTVYSDQDRENAIQDWWDAWREGADDEGSAFDWMQEVFGDQFGDVWDRIIQKLDQTEDQTRLNDIPDDWWRTTGSWSGTPGENGVTNEDLTGFRQLPAGIQKAVQAGAAAGVSGIRVNLDGQAVGTLVAPYVSAAIARDIG